MRKANLWKAAAIGLAAGTQLIRWLGRMDLSGKVVFITGGSRGLGLEVARVFAERGAQLALVARNPAELQLAQQELRERGAHVEIFACDVSVEHEVEATVRRAIEAFGGIDVVVNIAGIIQAGPLEAISLDDLHAGMDVNFWGLVHVCMAALPHLKAHGGRIVNITSIGGEVAVPHLLPYTASKFAATGFSTGIAAELAASGVRVTTVVPGLMRTGSIGQAFVKGQKQKEFDWFAAGDSLPLISMNARHAARRIVLACERGERYVVLGWPAKLLRFGAAILPTAVTAAMELTSRLLPDAGGAGPEQQAERGDNYREGVPKPLRALSDDASDRNNERTNLH